MYDIKYETNWTPEYSVCGDLMIFHNIDTPEKRLVMIKAYESFDDFRNSDVEVDSNEDGLIAETIRYKNEKQGEQKPTDNKMIEILRAEYEKGRADAIEEFQKEWSEEDEAVLDALTRRLEGEDIYVSPHLAVKFLKSLKDRAQPQPRQEWSDEDEQHIDSLLKRLEGLCKNEFERTRFAISEDEDWLKSIKDRYTWKPSDRQMKAIEHICDGNYNVDLDILDSIYKDFKKLREE